MSTVLAQPGQPALQARFRHRHRVRCRAQGAERRHHPADFGQEERARMAARVPPEGLSPLADDERAAVAERAISEDRFPGDQLLLGAQAEDEAQEHGRGRSGAAAHLREARRADARARGAGRRRGRRDLRQRVGGHHLQGKAGRGRHHFLLDLRGGAGASRAGARNTSARVVPAGDNFYAALNSAVFTDGSFCFIPKGVKCPMDLSTYFRINTEDSGQFERTLIVAEEGASVSYLEGCTAPQVRHQPAARGGGRAGRAGQCRHQVLDGAELVCGRRKRRGRHLQLRHQARPVQGRQLAHFLDPGRDRLGDHLEISVAAFCWATTRSASSTRSRSPTITSRPTPAPR